MSSRVRAIFITPRKGEPPVQLSSVEAVAGGLKGDWHSDPSNSRQILLVSGSVLDELQLEPGAIYENVVIDGMDIMRLEEGERLWLCDALVQVTIPCPPCIAMDYVRPGLRKSLRNRRGVFVKVVSQGTVVTGGPVESG
jgi:MOSC domain-containing protein YiiM